MLPGDRPDGDVKESEHLAIRMLESGRGLSGASRHPLPCRDVATATQRLSDLIRVFARPMHLLFLPGNGERVKNANCMKLQAKIKQLQEQDPEWQTLEGPSDSFGPLVRAQHETYFPKRLASKQQASCG